MNRQANLRKQIIDFSRSHGTYLIVMPARGRGTLGRLVLRSVTARELRGADCPVWTGAFTAQSCPKRRPIRMIACAVDLGPQSANVLRWASDFAAAFNAHLAVIRASAQLLPMGGVVHDPEWRVRVAQALTAQLSELVVTARINAEIRLASGEAGMAVASLVQRLGADLLVIGRGPAGFGRLLRPNAFSIISAVSVCGRQR